MVLPLHDIHVGVPEQALGWLGLGLGLLLKIDLLNFHVVQALTLLYGSDQHSIAHAHTVVTSETGNGC